MLTSAAPVILLSPEPTLHGRAEELVGGVVVVVMAAAKPGGLLVRPLAVLLLQRQWTQELAKEPGPGRNSTRWM